MVARRRWRDNIAATNQSKVVKTAHRGLLFICDIKEKGGEGEKAQRKLGRALTAFGVILAAVRVSLAFLCLFVFHK